MTEARDTAGGPSAAEVAKAELDFGQERSREAMAVLQALLGRGSNEPFKGTFEVLGKPPLEVADEAYVGDAYCKALKAFAEHEGATVGNWGEDGDLRYIPFDDGQGVIAAPFEKVMITALIPPKLIRSQAEAACHAMVACAECMRVLLAGAISAAKEDCLPGERVMLKFRIEPRFTSRRSFETDVLGVGGEMMLNIFTEGEPRVSYLLGSKSGGAPRKIIYSLPVVELHYGPNRLRWMDSRAPDAQRVLRIVGGVGG